MVAKSTVVVLGGGPAGCAAALALRSRGVATVILAERSDYQQDRIGECIPPDTRLIFERLGMLDEFERQDHEPCPGSCSSWGDDVLGYNDFALNPNGAGFHLDRRRFDAFLARRALHAGVNLVTNARFRSARAIGHGDSGSGFIVELETRAGVRRVPAAFVVDATGGGAAFARRRGARRLMHDRFVCATAYFHIREHAEFTHLTMLEAVPEGWWYAARLPDRRVVVALACEGGDLKSAALHSSASWLMRLSRTLHLAPALAHCFFIPESLRVCPVWCSVLDPPAGPRWLAAGDAASSYDPLSGQGVYKALANGLEAARVVQSALAGDDTAVERYSSAIRAAFAGFLGQRESFYAREQRWPDSVFWSRRRSPASMVPPLSGSKPLEDYPQSGERSESG